MRFAEQSKLKAVTFSYDDGTVQDIQLIELLNKYGLKSTFNLNSELFGQRGILDREGKRISHYKVHPEDVKYIYDGHEVAAHTLTHPSLLAVDEAEVIRQVEQDRLNLSELVGYEVVGMAYPGGGVNHTEEIAEIIRSNTGIRYARTNVCTDSFDVQNDLYRFQPNVPNMMDYDRLMKMGEEFVALETTVPQIFYIYGHSFEMEYASDNWSKLEEFFKLISNRDDIFYGTNAQVLL